MSSLMSHIKMAEMRATDEGCDLLARLIRSPGRPVSADDVTDRSLMEWYTSKSKLYFSGFITDLFRQKSPHSYSP